MKKTNLSWILGLLFVMALGISSCSDEFNEEEFIQQQADLAESKAAADHQRALEIIQAQLSSTLAAIQAQQDADEEIARLQAQLQQELELLRQSLENEEDSTAAANFLEAYRNMGLVNTLTLNFVDSDNSPVAGIEVSLSTNSTPQTTDDAGQVVYTDVVIGRHTVNTNDPNSLNLSVGINLPLGNLTFVNGQPIGQPRFLSGTLRTMSAVAGGDNVATIEGTLQGQVDLTTAEPELLEGVTVSVDLSATLQNDIVVNSDFTVTDFGFTEGTIGVATTDANGEFSMSVPVVDNQETYNFIVPQIEADQTLAIASRDGEALDAPEIATVPTVWDPVFSNWNNAAFDRRSVPFVSGVTVQLDQDTVSSTGTGIDFDFTVIPRSLTVTASTSQQDLNQTIFVGSEQYIIESRGTYTQKLPILVDQDDDTVGNTIGKGYVTELAVEEAGSGYTNIEIQLFQARTNLTTGAQFTSQLNLTTAPPALTPFTFSVTPDNGGLPSTIELPTNISYLSEGAAQSLNYFFNSQLDSVYAVVVGDGTGAQLSTSYEVRVDGFTTLSIPSDDRKEYSAQPTVAVSDEPGAINDAVIRLTEMQFDYEVSLDVSNADYSILPQEITFEDGEGRVDFQVSYTDASFSGSEDINRLIAFNQDGDIINLREGATLTTGGWNNPPMANLQTITNNDIDNFVFSLNNDGEVTSVQIQDPEGNPRGYIAEELTGSLVPSIPGISGSGGTFTFDNSGDYNTSGGFESGEKQYFNFANASNLEGGSGYLNNVNQIPGIAGPSVPSVTVRSGETQRVTIDLGTGIRQELVGG